MNGYWGDEEKTQAAFRDGWLRTGDLARRDEEGFYFLMDRARDMFISGGENVYTAEVERILAQHPAVAEVAVVGVGDPLWGQVGHAFLIARTAPPPDAGELTAFCSRHLATYKVPRHFTFCDAFPRTAIGKVKKTALVGTQRTS